MLKTAQNKFTSITLTKKPRSPIESLTSSAPGATFGTEVQGRIIPIHPQSLE